MGYYSDVAIAMKKTDLKLMLDEALKLEDDKWTYNFIEEGSLNSPVWNDEEYTLLYWSDVKWYDTKGEVTFIKDFLNHIEDGHYDFLRIGEAYDDAEWFYGTGEDFVYFDRSIGFGPRW